MGRIYGCGFGLQTLSEAGFEITRMEWLEGYFGTVSYQCRGIAQDLPFRGKGAWWLVALPAVAFARVGAWFLAHALARLDIRVKVTDRGYPKNYVVIGKAI